MKITLRWLLVGNQHLQRDGHFCKQAGNFYISCYLMSTERLQKSILDNIKLVSSYMFINLHRTVTTISKTTLQINHNLPKSNLSLWVSFVFPVTTTPFTLVFDPDPDTGSSSTTPFLHLNTACCFNILKYTIYTPDIFFYYILLTWCNDIFLVWSKYSSKVLI